MASKKKAAEPEFSVTPEWNLYRSKELVHVNLTEDGSVVIAHADGNFEVTDEESLASRYESAKGLVKGA